MELIEYSPAVRFIAVKPIARTKEKVLEIDPSIHCRVCSRIKSRAVSHDTNKMHTSTVKTYIEEE